MSIAATPSLQLKRRALLKSSLWAAMSVTIQAPSSVLAQSLFAVEGPDLRAFALKVTAALPPAQCQHSWAHLTQQLSSLIAQPGADVTSMLSLLHADDLACDRVLEVHGLLFSHTQIGVLTSLLTAQDAPV